MLSLLLRPRWLRHAVRAALPVDVRVRPVDPQTDGQALARFKKGQCFRSELTRGSTGDWLFLAAFAGTRVVGVVRAVRSRPGPAPLWEVAGLEVHPAHWGRHVGASLLREVLACIRREGGARAWLRVQARSVAAVRLYRSVGFSNDPGVRPGATRMSMDLGAAPRLDSPAPCRS